MRKPSVSVLLIAFASWACGGGDSSGTSTPPPPTTGTLMVSVSGLPAGASAQGSITGPAGFNASLTGTQLFQGLVPGLYTVTPSTVSNSGTTYISAAQSGNVVAGQTANVGVTYSRVDPFETVPIIVLKTTKPVIVADRIQQTIISYYPIQNGGGGTLTPVVSNANPASWVQLAVVGGNTLQATITATGLMPYSED